MRTVPFLYPLAALLVAAPILGQQRSFVLPDNVTSRQVAIWSEGTRMAGDLYEPKALAAGERRPTIIMSHGWGGTKAGLRGYASRFATAGYVVLAFDYRGWGESDGRLVVRGEMPEPDENGEATLKAQIIRNVVDPWDQLLDIRHAIDFVLGEEHVDPERLGYWGSSYSGAHAVWLAAHEGRLRCVVGQVAAADSVSLAQTSWQDQDIVAKAEEQAIQRARGEIDPVPQGTLKAPNLQGWTLLDKVVTYRPVEDAHRITIPILIIDAENEELFDRHSAGELTIARARRHGATAKYYVVSGITHYEIYRQAVDEAMVQAVEWFDEHLRGGA